MEINEELFDKIARLAKLEFSPEEKEEMMKDMEKILAWVRKLEEMDTGDVESLTSMSQEMNITREDKTGDHLPTDDIERNAPSMKDGFFKVPKVIDK